MATYFHGAQENIQPEAAQTLYLMNPTYIDYPATTTSTHQANNIQLFLNSSMNNSSLNSIQQQQQHHHFVGLPIQPSQYTTQSQDLSVMHSYNNVPIDVNQSQLCVRGPSNSNIVSVAQRGLSLSLSSQQVQGDQEMKIVGQSVLMGSKYLKIAQQLLDEVVNVEAMTGKGVNDSKKEVKRCNQELGEGDASGKKSDDLSTAERQELQMKKAKLVNMLDEVEQRYRQYHHQMQIIVSSFESAAGFGSAKTYTSLALQTISKQFRCLRDAISNQIRATSKTLGEEDCFANGGGKSVGSRLRFVDHQLRQQRALQQLGMIQNNAWRPQRGLPERAVSVLRAWLFEHFLHPYPKDSDKHMLAKQTGLTRSQVSNWFINARVRLWKPMVEEMYLEETKDQEQNNEGENKSTKSEEISDSPSQQENTIPSRTEQNDNLNPVQNNQMVQTSQHIQDMYNESSSIMQQRMKKIRSDDSTQMMSMGMKQYDMNNRDLLMKFMDQETGFEQYPIGEISRFDLEQIAPRFGSNGVSLTLGLPHGEPSYITNEGINHLENNNHFVGLNNNGNSPSSSNPNNGYESIDIQNRKQFAAQLLPDYVA